MTRFGTNLEQCGNRYKSPKVHIVREEEEDEDGPQYRLSQSLLSRHTTHMTKQVSIPRAPRHL